jgi:hypothetical protein
LRQTHHFVLLILLAQELLKQTIVGELCKWLLWRLLLETCAVLRVIPVSSLLKQNEIFQVLEDQFVVHYS